MKSSWRGVMDVSHYLGEYTCFVAGLNDHEPSGHVSEGDIIRLSPSMYKRDDMGSRSWTLNKWCVRLPQSAHGLRGFIYTSAGRHRSWLPLITPATTRGTCSPSRNAGFEPQKPPKCGIEGKTLPSRAFQPAHHTQRAPRMLWWLPHG